MLALVQLGALEVDGLHAEVDVVARLQQGAVALVLRYVGPDQDALLVPDRAVDGQGADGDQGDLDEGLGDLLGGYALLELYGVAEDVVVVAVLVLRHLGQVVPDDVDVVGPVAGVLAVVQLDVVVVEGVEDAVLHGVHLDPPPHILDSVAPSRIVLSISSIALRRRSASSSESFGTRETRTVLGPSKYAVESTDGIF